MIDDQLVLEDQYYTGIPVVKAKVVVLNPDTGRQAVIERSFRIDTGFDAGAHVPEVHTSEVDLIGVTPRTGTVMLAGGERRAGSFCIAYLQQIGDYELPAPGIEATLVLQGSSNMGLLGLEILKHFVTKFNGPKELLTITLENQP